MKTYDFVYNRLRKDQKKIDLSCVVSMTNLNKFARNGENIEIIYLDRVDNLRNIAGVRNMKKLTEFWSTDTNIHSARPLAELTELKRVTLFNSKIKDLKWVQKLVNLEYLDISCCPMPYKQLKNLKHLKKLKEVII